MANFPDKEFNLLRVPPCSLPFTTGWASFASAFPIKSYHANEYKMGSLIESREEIAGASPLAQYIAFSTKTVYWFRVHSIHEI
jgi:hypothetical protein